MGVKYVGGSLQRGQGHGRRDDAEAMRNIRKARRPKATNRERKGGRVSVEPLERRVPLEVGREDLC